MMGGWEKIREGVGKPDGKAYPLPCEIYTETSCPCDQKPLRNCTFMNSDSGPALTKNPAIFGPNQRQLGSKKTKNMFSTDHLL